MILIFSPQILKINQNKVKVVIVMISQEKESFSGFCTNFEIVCTNFSKIYSDFSKKQTNLSTEAINHVQNQQKKVIDPLQGLASQFDDSNNYFALNKVLVFLIHVQESMIADLEAFL